MQDCVRRAGDRVEDADRVLERLTGEDVARLDVALDEIDDRPSRLLGDVTSPRVDGRDRRAACQREPEPSVTQAMVEAVPMVMQWPFEREIEFSISTNSSSVIRPARNSSL